MQYSLIRLFKNIKYLMKTNLNERINSIEYNTLMDIEQKYIYELADKIKNIVKPKILDYDETLALVTTRKKSFCRIGDGEIDIMLGKDIPFQHYDPELARIMTEILRDKTTDMYIGINYSYFYDTSYMTPEFRKFYLMGTTQHREFLVSNCNCDRTYINATFNQIYMGGDSFNHEEYYNSLRHMFEGEKIVVFVGEGVLDNLKHDIFELSVSKEFIYGPSKDAFSEYKNILKKAKTYSKEYILCFILGPASKALVYQLTKDGYMAWDIGHMAKDYNAYKEKMVKDQEFVKLFYAPD